jgi:hypothetical protein
MIKLTVKYFYFVNMFKGTLHTVLQLDFALLAPGVDPVMMTSAA